MITVFSLYQGTNPVDITIFISIADSDVIEDRSIPQSTHTATSVCVEDMLVVSWLLKNCVRCVRSGLEVFHLLDCLQLNELLTKLMILLCIVLNHVQRPVLKSPSPSLLYILSIYCIYDLLLNSNMCTF